MQLMRRSCSNICPGLNLNTMMLLFMSFFACKRLELRCLNLGKIVDTLTNDRHSTYTSDSIQQSSKIGRLQVEKKYVSFLQMHVFTGSYLLRSLN